MIQSIFQEEIKIVYEIAIILLKYMLTMNKRPNITATKDMVC
ncbi:hypothetical protein B4090_2201 [Bacillus licheniformis]|nr:hypothetical protein B4090_2201 [Bacillus licheniformis]TWK02062.1 hypothetical protein CHCC20442_3341 [Bacillus licheniformis]TWK41529.1 hypothetical protein CHCC20347_0130 [Bacillus paralicheniformis]TWK69643.1 hypothetical protein CHCC20342_2361 [Bacillus licheniformis]